MGDAIKNSQTMFQNEKVRQLFDAEEKQRRDRMAELEFAQEEGMKKGMEKGVETVAVNLLKKNSAADFVRQVTGLSEKEVAVPRDRLNNSG